MNNHTLEEFEEVSEDELINKLKTDMHRHLLKVTKKVNLSAFNHLSRKGVIKDEAKDFFVNKISLVLVDTVSENLYSKLGI